MDFQNCLANQEKLKQSFSSLHLPEEKYAKIIELGRSLAPYPQSCKTPEYLVKGCQSLLHLKSSFKKGSMFFLATSDALISAGLASLLLAIYNGEPPEAIIKCPPIVLKELQITDYLSPNRSNGLRSLYLFMQRDALKTLATS